MIKYVRIRVDGGPVQVGTVIQAAGRRVLVAKRLTREEATERIARMLGKKKTATAARVYKQWHKRGGRVALRRVNLKNPFVFLGTVPVITYEANKTGRKVKYFHKPRRKPRLYFDPVTGAMLMIGGSTVISKGWMHR